MHKTPLSYLYIKQYLKESAWPQGNVQHNKKSILLSICSGYRV